MNALLHRFHNFIFPLLRGNERVCACTCGRHQVYHVVPYDEAQSMVASKENDFPGNIMTQQEVDVIAGLLLGLCVSWVLMHLSRVWLSGLKYWGVNRMTGPGFRPWMHILSNTKDLFRRLYPKHNKDSSRTAVHTNQDVYHHVNGSV